VAIPSLRGPEHHVQVSGQAEGPTAEFLKFVQSSPLRETAGAFTEGIGAEGRGKLRLKLDIPLDAVPRTRVAGDYEFAANRVALLSWLPPVEAASGRLAFTESSFTLHDVRGRLLGGPIGISGGTRAGRGVELFARGEASVEAARASLEGLRENPLGKQLAGSFGYFVTVRGQHGVARVTFESPLRGLESTLPAPFSKTAAEQLPLRVEVIPSARGERDRVLVSLGTLARAEAQRRRQGDAMVAQRTAVWFGPQRERALAALAAWTAP